MHMDGFDDIYDQAMTYDQMSRLVSAVSDVLAPGRWDIPLDFLERSHFDRVVKEIDWNSSPGVPYVYTATTNRILFKVVDGVPDQGICDAFWRLVCDRIRDRTADPIRLFVKPEPLKRKKLDIGRVRLISSVSVLDQIIDSMLFGDSNQRLIDTYHFHPIKVGWTPYKGGWMVMPQEGLAIDKSKWDFTVKSWIIAVELEVRKRLCNNLTQQWIDLATWRYTKLYKEAILQTSGGLLLEQKFVGYQKSGCVNTIVGNSIMQLILHCRVCDEIGEDSQWIAVMGDDTVQACPADKERYLDVLSKYCIVKDARRAVEFAGHRFMGLRVEPLYRGKHAFQMLHVSPAWYNDLARSYALLYHRSNYRSAIRNGLKTVPPIMDLDVIFDALDE